MAGKRSRAINSGKINAFATEAKSAGKAFEVNAEKKAFKDMTAATENKSGFRNSKYRADSRKSHEEKADEGIRVGSVKNIDKVSGTDATKDSGKTAGMIFKSDADFFAKHDADDEQQPADFESRRDAVKARRRHLRKKQQGMTGRDTFIQSDGNFHDFKSFAEEVISDNPDSAKLVKLEDKAEKASGRTASARRKLPQRKEYRLEKVIDEKTGNISFELKTNKVIKKPKKKTPMTAAKRRAMMEAQGALHQKVAETEQDNTAVEAAHKSEEAAEKTISTIAEFKRGREVKKYKKAVTLEKKQFKKEADFIYHKHLEENPALKKKHIQKRIQKQHIRNEYAKALKRGAEVKEAAVYAQQMVQTTATVSRKIQEFTRRHLVAILSLGVLALFFMALVGCVSSCAAAINGGVSTTMGESYNSVPAELDACDEYMTEMELDLQNDIDNIETDYEGYDEYNYNLDEIGHNPFTLINYLSAIQGNVALADVEGEIELLFEEMYELTLTSRQETRTRTVTNEESGEEEEEEYTVNILDVELTRTELEDIVAERLTGDDQASSLYATYQQTNGALQQFYTPLDLDWYFLIKSYYGYRKNPMTGENQFHRGIDIAVPEGTEVYAGHDGTVTTAEYDDDYGNYIVIQDSQGFTTKYAHLESMNVSAGQAVKHGAVIGKTGSTGAVTGSHLHLECLSGGEYYNPLFYFENGNGSIYGTTDPIGGSGDAAGLIAFAEQFLGMPYVWGGSSPSTSFDCSGFVCYSLTHSGYCNMPRTTAQGIYNQCTPISPGEAQPGDLIFFTKTYNSGNPVTHVGIYVGGGQMLHCGDPIKYSSINTPYWQSHFYGFARVPH